MPTRRPADDGRTLSTTGIAALLGLSSATIRIWAASREDFPLPCEGITKRTRRWDRKEILAWRDALAAKIQKRPVASDAVSSSSSDD